MEKLKTITLIKKLNVTDLAGDKVMIDFESGKYFLLKGVANDIWDYIQEPITLGEIEAKLMTEYEVDAETCHKAVVEFLERLSSNRFIQIN